MMYDQMTIPGTVRVTMGSGIDGGNRLECLGQDGKWTPLQRLQVTVSSGPGNIAGLVLGGEITKAEIPISTSGSAPSASVSSPVLNTIMDRVKNSDLSYFGGTLLYIAMVGGFIAFLLFLPRWLGHIQ